METRNLTCIGCPMGCQITVEFEGETIRRVTGNSCAVGDKYARREVTHPERTVTSTVVVTGGDRERLSVKTRGNIPKNRIFDCMREINRRHAECRTSRVSFGQPILFCILSVSGGRAAYCGAPSCGIMI